MNFIEKIEKHIYPSKEELIELNTQNLNREEICNILHISPATYKKLMRFYQLPKKRHKVDKSTYPKRQIKIQQTLDERYGQKGTDKRKEFYKQNRKKQEQTCLKKYGVKDPTILPEFMNKRKNTCLKIYGVDNPMKSQICQEKAQQTDLIRYGNKNHIASDIVRQKAKTTLKNEYGVEYAAQVPEVLEKRDKTNLQKYGYKCCLSNPDIREKGYQTMKQNGTTAVLSSKQQVYINNLFHGELNYLIGYYHVDSYLSSDNIIVEYSGSGHDLSVRLGRETLEHFQGKEKSRRNYFRNKNISMIEFVSKKDKLPEDNILLQYLSDAKKVFSQGNLYYCVDIDTGSIKYN